MSQSQAQSQRGIGAEMEKILLMTGDNENKRIALGVSYIKRALEKAGYQTEEGKAPVDCAKYRKTEHKKIYVGELSNDRMIDWLLLEELLIFHAKEPKAEGFTLETCPGELTVVCGGDDTGALYGCLELAERIEKEGSLPKDLVYADAPVYKLRGPAVGLQKTKLEPPRLTYEYPITPDRFPWFYDKAMWQKFLDMLLSMRCNVLYIWSGHPFSSLVKVPEYPEALEVTEEEFQKNKEVFGWLTEECDKRGIWVVLKFYNIHISYPFAQAHGLELLQSNIHPLVEDYTRKSIKEFIKAFPHIGLMVCLGEALRGTQNKTDWFIKTIIPAVKDGIAEAKLLEEPPIILRGHDCDPIGAMTEAKKIYSNLYTMWKYNGEGLTTCFPKGKWQKTHQGLAALGTTHIMNIHILADLEPFQYNAPRFIQKCVQAGTNRLGTNGLHLYPLFYWDWPYTPDNETKRLLQIDRDELWYKAWFRYAWNPDREEKDENTYWTLVVAERYKISVEAAAHLLEAMEAAGQCAPRILQRVGITEGNRQTMSLGMLMSQFTNVIKYRPNKELWYSVARRGEQPDDYVKHELAGEDHIGETPYDMVKDVTAFARKAQDEYKAASKLTKNITKDMAMVGTDIDAIALMTYSYSKKVEAAMEILFYKYTMDEKCFGDASFLEKAEQLMKESLDYYRELSVLTTRTYLYANSMQTPQRKIPFPNGETYGHWNQCLQEYELEFRNFKKHRLELADIVAPGSNKKQVEAVPLTPAPYKLLSAGNAKDLQDQYILTKGAAIFTDCDYKIQNLAPELSKLTGVRMGLGKAIEGGVTVKLELEEDSFVLIGYMNGKGVEWLQLPDLETNTHADDRGGLTVVYANAVKVESCPVINIHAYRYEKGIHEIYFGTGAYMIAGVISQKETIIPRNADLAGEGYDTLDWMYEE